MFCQILGQRFLCKVYTNAGAKGSFEKAGPGGCKAHHLQVWVLVPCWRLFTQWPSKTCRKGTNFSQLLWNCVHADLVKLCCACFEATMHFAQVCVILNTLSCFYNHSTFDDVFNPFFQRSEQSLGTDRHPNFDTNVLSGICLLHRRVWAYPTQMWRFPQSHPTRSLTMPSQEDQSTKTRYDALWFPEFFHLSFEAESWKFLWECSQAFGNWARRFPPKSVRQHPNGLLSTYTLETCMIPLYSSAVNMDWQAQNMAYSYHCAVLCPKGHLNEQDVWALERGDFVVTDLSAEWTWSQTKFWGRPFWTWCW